MKSNRFQINAFVAQFSALFAPNNFDQPLFEEERGGCSWADPSRVENVAVVRATPELLRMKPQVQSYSSGLANWCDEERAMLFDRNWRALAKVRPDTSGEVCGSSRWSHDGETIGEAISRAGCRHDVAFIVVIHSGHDIQDFYSVGGYDVTIHKAPKGWTISEWIAREERRAKNELLGKLNDIDRVA